MVEDDKSEEKVRFQAMVAEFGKYRDEYSSVIDKVSKSFSSTKDIIDNKQHIYAVRQKLVDYKRTILIAIKDLQRQFTKIKKDRMMKHRENKIPIVFTNKDDKKIYDDAFFSNVTYQIAEFDAQLEWCRDSIASCDQIINGFSYHIKLVSLLK